MPACLPPGWCGWERIDRFTARIHATPPHPPAHPAADPEPDFTGPPTGKSACTFPGSVHRQPQAGLGRSAGGDLHLTAFSAYDAKTETTKASLELQVPDKKKRKVIYAEGEYTSFTVFPSPDGKRVALWCRHPGEAEVYDPLKKSMVPRVTPLATKNTLVVFDDRGEVIATVDPE